MMVVLRDRMEPSPSLVGQKCPIIFGNLEDIYQFHSQCLLPELERCVSYFTIYFDHHHHCHCGSHLIMKVWNEHNGHRADFHRIWPGPQPTILQVLTLSSSPFFYIVPYSQIDFKSMRIFLKISPEHFHPDDILEVFSFFWATDFVILKEQWVSYDKENKSALFQ